MDANSSGSAEAVESAGQTGSGVRHFRPSLGGNAPTLSPYLFPELISDYDARAMLESREMEVMQRSSLTAYSREIVPASERLCLEERNKQATNLIRDFQEWIEAVAFDGGAEICSVAMQGDMVRRYVSLIDHTFKELVRMESTVPTAVEHSSNVSRPFMHEEKLKRVA